MAVLSPLAARPDLLAPAALARLREALWVGQPNGRLLRAVQAVDRWCDCPIETAQAEFPTVDRALIDRALTVLRTRALDAMGLLPGDDLARVAAFAARAHSPAEADAARRYGQAVAIGQALGPSPFAALPVDSPLYPALEPLIAQQPALLTATTPGQVQGAGLDALDTLVGRYQALLGQAAADDPIVPTIAAFAASAAYGLARGRELNGELARASDAYALAATLYLAADEPDQADAARDDATRTHFALHADVDGASLADLGSLAHGIADPLARARALFRLAERARDANDSGSALV